MNEQIIPRTVRAVDAKTLVMREINSAEIDFHDSSLHNNTIFCENIIG